MKLITFISAGSFIFFSAFVMKKNSLPAICDKTGQSSALYDKKWVLHKIHQGDSVLNVAGNAFIRFDQQKKSAGGNGGCNSFGSTILVSGNTISIKDIISTEMYCEGIQETEDAFFKQLEAVNRFEIKGNKLLLYKDKAVLLELEKGN